MKFLRLFFESIRFALGAFKINFLRTILSLLGVTVGIFAIVSVFTLVDSLEKNIKETLKFLDVSTLDIRRFPYEFGPNIPWWEYIKRPYTNYEEYEFLMKNLKNINGITIFSVKGGELIKHKSGNFNDATIIGVAYTHQKVYDVISDVNVGRYFTEIETRTGKNVAIIGYKIANQLFINGENFALGKEIKIKGLKYIVVGIMEEEGENVFGESGNDELVLIPYHSFRKIFFLGKNKGIESLISIKGKEDQELEDLRLEIGGLLRKSRGLKPKQKDNFSVNRQDAIINIIGNTFDIITLAGWVIGSFSILVGGVGIANIMFVSVRERTGIIGIQKSLGATNFFILSQFLFESIFLSLLGGIVGISMVYGLSFISIGNLDIILSFSNVVLGLLISTVIGVVSGIIPAYIAARLDPVLAIRTNG